MIPCQMAPAENMWCCAGHPHQHHRHPRENEDWTLVQVPVSVSWCAPARRYIRELIQREIKQTMKITSVFGPHYQLILKTCFITARITMRTPLKLGCEKNNNLKLLQSTNIQNASNKYLDLIYSVYTIGIDLKVSMMFKFNQSV